MSAAARARRGHDEGLHPTGDRWSRRHNRRVRGRHCHDGCACVRSVLHPSFRVARGRVGGCGLHSGLAVQHLRRSDHRCRRPRRRRLDLGRRSVATHPKAPRCDSASRRGLPAPRVTILCGQKLAALGYSGSSVSNLPLNKSRASLAPSLFKVAGPAASGSSARLPCWSMSSISIFISAISFT